jgi:hypothetical protein
MSLTGASAASSKVVAWYRSVSPFPTSVARSIRVPAGEVRNTSRCEAFGWLIDTVALTSSRRAPRPATSISELRPVVSLSGMAPPSPSRSAVGEAGGSDESVEIVSDQLRSLPVEPRCRRGRRALRPAADRPPARRARLRAGSGRSGRGSCT